MYDKITTIVFNNILQVTFYILSLYSKFAENRDQVRPNISSYYNRDLLYDLLTCYTLDQLLQ